MGLIKAALGAAGGVLADQWKEYIYSDAIDGDVLLVKGKNKASRRSSNKKGEDNVISDGSVISVADGQCMIIVEQGKVSDICAVPGEFQYSNSTEPSIFTGDLGDSIKASFQNIGRRFSFGGGAGGDQRVYFCNIKEILGNKYGTATPVPFRVVDRNIGLDIDISIRCNGEYSYRIVDPILFYTNVCGNVDDEYGRENLDSMLKTELMTALQPALSKISDLGVRYSSIPAHTEELAGALNQILSAKWRELRGIEIASMGVNSVSASKEDEDMIKQLQRNAVMRDPTMAAANLVGAQAQAMQDAAKNSGGAFVGFAGMNAAQGAGGVNAQSLYGMGQQVKQPAGQDESSWTCKCGSINKGKFCNECGAPKPENTPWVCSCGESSTGKFCTNCGKPRPSGGFKCNKCGWTPENSKNLPKFCPECGDIFDDGDKI